MAQEGLGLMKDMRTHPHGRGLVKRYGRVTAIDHADFDLFPARCWR